VLRRILFASVFVPATMFAQVSPASPPATRPAPAQAGVPTDPSAWRIDKTHSELTFQIRHFMSRVRGTFRDWKGTVTLPDVAKWENAAIDVEIQTPSIFTDNERRDADLRSSNFFAADSFPTITFKSMRIERTGDAAKIFGDLTIRGVTKPVVLDGRYLGLQNNANGSQRLGFEATTTVNRLDYGVKWNRAVEGGGVMLGDDVKIEIAIEAVRQAARS
jgi:polyisoprenoid-binding protein YceI